MLPHTLLSAQVQPLVGGLPGLFADRSALQSFAGLHTWAVVLIVFACLGVVAGAGYVAYRLRLRSAMHQEIRAIMAQYMPLESQEGVNGGDLAMPRSPATNGAAPHTDV